MMQAPGLRVIGIALAGVLVSASASVAASEPPSEGSAFGDYEPVPLLLDAEPYTGPTTSTSLAEVRVSRLVDERLTTGARERLAEQGFVIVPGELRLFHHAYTESYGTGTPVFVTTDAAYHAWHLVFDKILRDVEQTRLLPVLEDLVKGMRRNAARQRNELAGTALADEAERVHDLLAVTASVLGVRSAKLSERAGAEIALIEAHSAWEDSPIVGTKTDYSLFTPRGHYTRNEDLTRYFVAMSVLGQYAFYLPGARLPDGASIDETDGLRLAVLASRTIVGDAKLEELWSRIFEPSAFLVGVADDYSPFELAAAVEVTVPGGWADPERVTDEDTLRAIGETLKRAPRAGRSGPPDGAGHGHPLRAGLMDPRPLPCADGRPGRDVWLHGEYFCYVSAAGNALLRWTDERSDTYGVINAAAGRKDLERLYRHREMITNGSEDAG